MKCSREILWKAVEEFCPQIVQAKNVQGQKGIYLADCVKLAAIEAFRKGNNNLSLGQLFAVPFIREALEELKEDGLLHFEETE